MTSTEVSAEDKVSALKRVFVIRQKRSHVMVPNRHAEWRKFAKKMRRKRIRSAIASKRDKALQKEQEERERSPTYQSWVKEQDSMEVFKLSEEERQAELRRKVWLEEERAAAIRWQEQQVRLANAKAEKVKQEMLIREEWESVQKKLKEAEEAKKKSDQEKKKKEDEILAQIDAFISGQGQFPAEADVSTETHPGHPVCPFFSKTGACRFRDNCSRNHIRPGISKVLLIPNFYEHLGIQTLHQSEYDTDVGLEYEDSDTYHHFLEFYNDILPEFESCGRIIQLNICSNEEPHLRGNVYVEYSKERYAMKGYRKFQGRFYAGRQLSVEFCSIPLWKNAICGLYHLQRCPKGRTCNFLHVFWNPKKPFNGSYVTSCSRRSFSKSPSRNSNRMREENWNWSDSSGSENESRKKRSESIDSRKQSTTRRDEREKRNYTDRREDHRKRRRSKSPKKENRKWKHVSESRKKTKQSDVSDSNETSERFGKNKDKKKNKSNKSDDSDSNGGVSDKLNKSNDKRKRSKTENKHSGYRDRSCDSSVNGDNIQK